MNKYHFDKDGYLVKSNGKIARFITERSAALSAYETMIDANFFHLQMMTFFAPGKLLRSYCAKIIYKSDVNAVNAKYAKEG